MNYTHLVFFITASILCQAKVIELQKSDQFMPMLSNNCVMVKFYLPACPHCKQFAPQFEALSEQHKNISFVAIDADKHGTIADQYNILRVPHCIGFKNGTRIGDADASRIKQVHSLLEKLDK